MEIKGTITFTVSRHENGGLQLSYDQNLENDIGALAICQGVLVEMENHFLKMKKAATEKIKGAPKLKDVNSQIEKIKNGQRAISFATGYSVSMYETWQKIKEERLAAEQEKKPENEENKGE